MRINGNKPAAPGGARVEILDYASALAHISTRVADDCPRDGRKRMLSALLNVLWIFTGGLWMTIAWLIAAVLMAITIIGLPWARAALNVAAYTLLPFGYTALPRDLVSGRPDFGTGALGFVGNLIWFVLAGWWLALGHVITAVALALTIIGIPFAWAHLKLAVLSLWPVGKAIVTADEAEAILGRTRRSAARV